MPLSIMSIMLRSQTTSRITGRKRPRIARRGAKKQKAIPVWEELLRIGRTIPETDLHKLPTDASVNHDHYLYGGHSA